jgi:putative membrane protein
MEPDFAGKDQKLAPLQLASRRTSLSFQRTRMGADRTLMAIVRTSLSLIGFGFTIFQFFRYLRESAGATDLVRVEAPRNFGLALVLLGVAMQTLGIWDHVAFMLNLRKKRRQFMKSGLIEGDDRFPVSTTLIVATALLLIGLVAITGMVFRAGPFH